MPLPRAAFLLGLLLAAAAAESVSAAAPRCPQRCPQPRARVCRSSSSLLAPPAFSYRWN